MENTCGINKQQLVVMSYSRYCRYRAQLQRKREEQLNKRDIAIVTNGDIEKNVVTTYQGIGVINTTRVLFCRDTYDYPAELLLEPFNAQQCQQQNTSVLVNHLGMYTVQYNSCFSIIIIIIIVKCITFKFCDHYHEFLVLFFIIWWESVL